MLIQFVSSPSLVIPVRHNPIAPAPRTMKKREEENKKKEEEEEEDERRG